MILQILHMATTGLIKRMKKRIVHAIKLKWLQTGTFA